LKLEERAAMPLAGGLMGNGYQCGMLWGATLAAGAQAYRLLGPGPQAETEAVIVAQRLVESFQARHKHINCSEIANIEWKASSQRRMLMQVAKFFARGGPIICFSNSAGYARAAYSEISAAYSENHIEPPSAPVSCAALLARKMGVSDMHAVMAAGFAGGIGLSGGGCGALGAAIWIRAMNSGKEGVESLKMIPPWAEEVIDRFMQGADYEFECSKIVGRKFENIADHAGYLHNGGCSKIIEALAIQ
jgi:hypothetical protein